MRAALLSEYHRPLELIERPEPEPTGARSVVVRIGGAGVCQTDLHTIDGHMEPAGVRLPLVLGHENAGWVHAVGDDVTAAAVGDPVLLYPPYSCGLCVPCRRGAEVFCDRHEFTGLTQDGGFADYVVVDERSLLRLPEGVEPAEVAPHADAGITAYHAVKKQVPRLDAGSTTVVIGVGGVGHIGLQLVKVLGSGGRVIGVDTDERRRRLARELGADEVLGEEPDVAGAVAGADERGRRRRRVRLRGHGRDAFARARDARAARPVLDRRLRRHDHAPVGRLRLRRDIAIAGNLVGNWIDLWELLQLHGRGAVTLRSETHPLEEVNDVLDRLREGEVTGRAVLVP